LKIPFGVAPFVQIESSAIQGNTLTQEPWTILKLIRWTGERFQKEGLSTPRLDAEVLLSATLGMSRVKLYTHFDQPVLPEELNRFKGMIQRRLKREPVAYILGEREFWSLPFKVTRDVLIPRPETETLVSESIQLFSSGAFQDDHPQILEIGTGSGAISISLATELPAVAVVATDISEKALAVAAENAARHQVSHRIRLIRGDLFSPLPMGAKFHLILSNPPYISREQFSDLPPDVRDFEPPVALEGGKDGLEFYRQAFPHVSEFLLPGGWLLMEIGAGQDRDILQIVSKNRDLDEFDFIPDLTGIKRVFKARKRTP
jgi:release factor glutamine methyltransferase